MRTVTSLPRMYADQPGLKHGDLTKRLIGVFFDLYNKVLIELKTGRDIELAWEKQLLNCLRATDIEVGLLFNFGPNAQFRRYVFENDRKNPWNPRVSAGKKLPGSCG